MLFFGLFGQGDGDQLHLVELVLAQHAARIAARRPCLGPEAGRPGGDPPGELPLLQQLPGGQAGERHLRRRDEPAVVGGAEEVLAELRQLTGPVERLAAHKVGRNDLLIAVLFRVQVDHELRQRPVQARQGALQDREARARHAACRLELKAAKGLAELEMLLYLEGEGLRLAPAAHFLVRALVGADGNVGVGQVRDAREQVFQRLPRFRLLLLQFAETAFQAGHLGDLGLGILTGAFLLADPLGGVVALCLQFLQLRDGGAARLVERDDLRGQGLGAPVAQGLVEGVGIFANPLEIKHGSSFGRPRLMKEGSCRSGDLPRL
jgi:hypothetical protein